MKTASKTVLFCVNSLKLQFLCRWLVYIFFLCRFLARPNSTFAVTVLDMFFLPFFQIKGSLCIVIKAQINIWDHAEM